uniref:Thymine dioxygenase JBP1 n=1 Tax=Crithidia fasciculata TaxID=5656 RepID=JBP1_CRIFA
MEPKSKKVKQDIFNFPDGKDVPTTKEKAEAYVDALKAHPFYDNVHSVVDVYDSATLRDGKGRVIGVMLRKALPEHATTAASGLLSAAAVRTSLRSSMFGGESPLSGIAGYFDYRGSPVELKARKTAFTYEHEKKWPAVFPLVDYVSEIYKSVMPEHWAAQDSAIPDIVRIHGTPFSTLTINSRFRTASHTDAGDFDGGYSCIACIDGDFKGLALGFDDFHVNVPMQPRDVLVFDSHYFHSNSELEISCPTEEWRRLTCVFYYRSALGEPSSYAEYRRRLAAAQQDSTAQPVVSSVVEKPNGKNLYKPSTVFPIDPTPFAVVAQLHRLHHCAAKGLCVHELLAVPSSPLAVLLFGERLSCSDGIPLRAAEQKLKANADGASRGVTSSGGFSESDAVLTTAVEKSKYLERDHLSQCISAELLAMWVEARKHWLRLVATEWARMIATAPERTDFLWKNKSPMNTAFFDLCEVAKQVMLGLLDKETATPTEERHFWSVYAAHLHRACAERLMMPEEAMSLRKLNVKLKDFSFGGTRYFKDMPVEEQERRVARKASIEEARRRSTAAKDGEQRSNWLTNDAFDYQTEDCEVDYAGHGWAVPKQHAKTVTANVHQEAVAATTEAVRVLVVLPRPPSGDRGDAAVDLPKEVTTSAEWVRLMSSPAVRRVLAAKQRNLTLLPNCNVEAVSLNFAYHDSLPQKATFDFVVLQHVLSAMPEDAIATDYVSRMRSICTGCLFVVETDVQCRQYFTLHYPLRVQYDAVAPAFFQLLHRCSYGTPLARTRTKAEVEALFPFVCCARYKLQGSPMNTVVHLLALE